MTSKKNHPLAVCTQCKTYTNNVELINQRCHQIIQNKRCQGVFRSALSDSDWTECPIEGGGWIYNPNHKKLNP